MISRSILLAALPFLVQAAVPPASPPPAAPTLEEQVLADINAVRTNPAAYAATLRTYRTYFQGNLVALPGSDVHLRTREGVAAVDQAIAFLSKMPPARPLLASPPLAQAAQAHVKDQATSGAMGHIGADGRDAQARIKKHTGSGFMAEALSFGSAEAQAIVRQLIVDDGAPTRPNRKIVLDKRYYRAGIACGVHPAARTLCVIDLATFVGVAPAAKERRGPPPQIDIF